MENQDVFQGKADSFTKKELADIINAAFSIIDHYVTNYPDEAGPIKEVGKIMMEMILQDTEKHIRDKEIELKCAENEIELKEVIETPLKNNILN